MIDLYNKLKKDFSNVSLKDNKIELKKDKLLFRIIQNYEQEICIEVLYLNRGKNNYLTHFHLNKDEVFDKLQSFNSNKYVFVVKKCLFTSTLDIILKEEYNQNKYRNNIFCKYYIIE